MLPWEGHPSEVAGMVLADPTNEHQAEGYNRVDGRSYADWDRANQRSFRDSERCVAAAATGKLVVGHPLYESCAAYVGVTQWQMADRGSRGRDPRGAWANEALIQLVATP